MRVISIIICIILIILLLILLYQTNKQKGGSYYTQELYEKYDNPATDADTNINKQIRNKLENFAKYEHIHQIYRNKLSNIKLSDIDIEIMRRSYNADNVIFDELVEAVNINLMEYAHANSTSDYDEDDDYLDLDVHPEIDSDPQDFEIIDQDGQDPLKTEIFKLKQNQYKSFNLKMRCIKPDKPKLHVVGDVHGSLLTLFAPLVASRAILPFPDGRYFRFNKLDDVFEIDFNKKCKSIVAYSGDIVERAHHRHSMAMLNFVIDLAMQHPKNIKFTFGNHDFDLFFGNGLNEYEIVEEMMSISDGPKPFALNTALEGSLRRKMKKYINNSDIMPFICLIPEYNTIVSHTLQYNPLWWQNKNDSKKLTGKDMDYINNTAYSSLYYILPGVAITYEKSKFYKFIAKFYDKHNKSYLFTCLNEDEVMINIKNINEYLKQLASIILDDNNYADTAFAIYQANNDDDKFFRYAYLVISSFLWQRPYYNIFDENESLSVNTGIFQSYRNSKNKLPYKYHIIGHTGAPVNLESRQLLINYKYLLVYNDFSYKNNLDTLITQWTTTDGKELNYNYDTMDISDITKNYHLCDKIEI